MFRSPRGLAAALVLGLAGGVALTASAVAQTAAPAPAPAPAADPVVATVNGQSIRLSDVQRQQQTLPEQYRALPLHMIFPALLDQMVDRKLMIAEARKAEVQKTEDYKRRMADLEERLAQDVWLTREVEKRVTPDLIKARYEKKIKEMPAEEEVSARHILVASEDDAKKIIEELGKGGDFAKIAKDKSTDKASGAQGGDLGWFKKGDMVKEFAEAAFALEKGKMTPAPIKTQFGYHIIKLEDRRKAGPPPLAELEDEIKGELTREAFSGMIEGLRKAAKIEKFNMDGSRITEAPPGAVPAPAPAAKPPEKK
ncbi:MAG: peptidylprolyl isomerase [Alphaproteobacteria bacterium]|nr:peptidylprolyl isomerase [Alphaproteobacteria bacterium]